MANAAKKLWINRQDQTLSNYLGAITSLPELFQYNDQDYEIGFVDPPTNPTSGTFSVVNMSAYGLRVSVGAQPNGTPGDTPLAIQTSWTYNGTSNIFTGTLSLNTAAVNTYLTGVADRQAWFEVTLTLAGFRQTMLQGTFDLAAVVDEGSSTPPTPAASYPTWDDARATFVKFSNNPGETILLKSPSGVYGRLIGVDDTGAAIDSVIVL